ncbi:MAG: hypothetical protein O9293_00210 [Porphyrobacter sp.]|jgi:hypothetical protein|nr:hypothetical protein [Porphyrobacter sp.]
MDHHYRDLSAAAVVIAFTLLLSTTLIVMSPHVTLPPASGAPVTKVEFSQDPLGHAGATDGVGTPADPALSRHAAKSAVRADDDFVPMPAAGNDALDSDFARTQLARANTNDSRAPAGAVRIAKDLYAGSKLAGRIQIVVLPDGEMLVQGSELKSLLAGPDFAGEATLARRLGNGLVSLRDLREAGIDLRYSPEDDSFRIVG